MTDEYFASGDERFLDEVLRLDVPQKLAALAEPWYRDERPAMRRMFLAYVDDGCDRPEHKALVKRLFKLAEGAGDDEAMAHFMVAFDGLLQRSLRAWWRWDYTTSKSVQVWSLRPRRRASLSKREARSVLERDAPT